MSKLTTLPKIEIQARQGLAFDPPKSALAKWNTTLTAKADDATISILDIIGFEDFGGVTAKRISSALRAIGDRDVKVIINSPGGDMFEGIAIYNLLRNHPGKVTVQVIGLAASAASLIAMAGDTIQMSRASFLMIHNVLVLAIGNRNELRDVADFLEPFDDALADVYAARSGMDKKKVAKLMDAETWMNGTQAIEQGFADELMAADAVSEGQGKDKDKWKDAQAVVRGIDAALLKGGVKREERIGLMTALHYLLDAHQDWQEAFNARADVSPRATESNQQPTEPQGSPSNDSGKETEMSQPAAPAAPAAQPENPQAAAPAAPAAPAVDAVAAAVKAERERGNAIRALPEAKGREQLANELVNQGMSVEAAKAVLAAAPKASKLDDHMGNYSPSIGSDDPPEPQAPVAINPAGIYASRRQAVEKARAH
jgi:ATP-dependent Clp protease protease subunit